MYDQDETNRLKKWEEWEAAQTPTVLRVDEPKSQRPSVSFHAHLHISNYDQPQTYDYPVYGDYRYGWQVHPILITIFGLGFLWVLFMFLALLLGGA